jgi:ribosomal protein S18 acetylase RimI-like enzyme
MNDFCIRPMTIQDAHACATVHMCSFQGFFLTFLGHRFLYELYRAVVQDSYGITFVAEKEGRVVGFVAGATCMTGLYRRLLRNSLWRFAWASSKAFIQKPIILPRLLRVFSMASKKDPISNCGTLMSIGVLPEIQGQGIGRCLVQAFLTEANQRGLEQVTLATDRDKNDRTNLFYQRLGFSVLREYATPEGRWMNIYIIPLSMPELAGANS